MGDEHRRETTTVRLVDPTHDRLKSHNREGETLSGTVGRALDALEERDELAENVAENIVAMSDVPPKVLVLRDSELTADDAQDLIDELETVADTDTTDEA